jgi:hypothetical protein
LRRQRILIAAAVALGAALASMPIGAATAPSTDALDGHVFAIAADVEQAAARTRPPSWPLKRACLYYALAGQHLLARRGIDAALRIGTVVYDPGTTAAHRISPHAWLETASHLVDYAMLPRRGRPTLVPLGQVARDTAGVVPGRTRVLALTDPDNRQLRAYLAVHRARFARLMLARPFPAPAPRHR